MTEAVLDVDISTEPLAIAEVETIAVGVFAPSSGERDDPVELAADALAVGDAMEIDLVGELRAVSFDASVGAIASIPTRRSLRATSILAVGLGTREKAGTGTLRRAAAAVADAAERTPSMATGLHTALADDRAEVAAAAQAVTEGVLLGAYRFTEYRSDPRGHQLRRFVLATTEERREQTAAGVRVGRVTAGASCLVRDLVNTPPQDKRPPRLAERVVELVSGLPIATRVLGEDELAREGYGGIVGVGQGSSEPPRLVELRYTPADPVRRVALVGKGITFDTGGLSLKPSASMETMKADMAGAASVLAAIRAAAELELPVEVTAVLALAENMPSGTATRVSDVLTAKDGTTIEVINTDAEGRLVLADAIVHACGHSPEVVVDVATLTGAAVIALGDRIGVVVGNDDTVAGELVEASAEANEPLWRLPLAKEEYGDRVEGTVADLKNVGGRPAGTIFGALFLERFVAEGVAWAHLDVAGTAWTNEAYGEHPKGATGIPARTLVAWLGRS